jgi:hypothetical protein
VHRTKGSEGNHPPPRRAKRSSNTPKIIVAKLRIAFAGQGLGASAGHEVFRREAWIVGV